MYNIPNFDLVTILPVCVVTSRDERQNAVSQLRYSISSKKLSAAGDRRFQFFRLSKFNPGILVWPIAEYVIAGTFQIGQASRRILRLRFVKLLLCSFLFSSL
jgi:hypothetical protein